MTKERVLEGDNRVPLSLPEVTPEDTQAVLSVLAGSQLALGPQLKAFETSIATYVGTDHAVAVNSGTSALHLVIRALGIGPGDEVITTPFSFIASTNCILMEGATPVFADIDSQTLCIDPDAIEEAITDRTVAVLAVDVFGHPADWNRLEEIAKKHNLFLIDDSAESLGSLLDNRPCGSFGNAGICAFYPNKQITTGEGGMVVTNDENLAEMCRSMANQGRGDGGWLNHVRLGFNYRMDEMSAALGLSQLKRLGTLVDARARIASWYEDELSDIEEIATPTVAKNVRMSWFVYVIRLANRFSRADRDQVICTLREQGIGCRDYFQPIHLQSYIRERLGTGPGQYPVTESVGDRTIALPFFPQMTRDQVQRVAESLSGAILR